MFFYEIFVLFIRRQWYWKKRFAISICLLGILAIAGVIIGSVLGTRSHNNPTGTIFDILFVNERMTVRSTSVDCLIEYQSSMLVITFFLYFLLLLTKSHFAKSFRLLWCSLEYIFMRNGFCTICHRRRKISQKCNFVNNQRNIEKQKKKKTRSIQNMIDKLSAKGCGK